MHSDIHRVCCTFDTFLNAFMRAAHQKRIPLLCVNRLEARRDWRRGMTGFEALNKQALRLNREGLYCLQMRKQ